MNRTSFDNGITYLLSSFARPHPRADVLDAWYQHVRDIDHGAWKDICQRIVRDVDSFPANLPKAVLAYWERPRTGESVINQDTGLEYTWRESGGNRNRVTALLQIMAHDTETRREILQCADASFHEGGGDASRSRWGAHIVERLDTWVVSHGGERP